MTTREELHSDLATPPGLFLQEVLDDLGMSQAELARRMGRPPQAINEIIKGLKELTPQTAIQLEQVVDIPAHIWVGLESEYRLVRAREQDQQALAKETELLLAFPYSEMVRIGCVARVRRGEEKVRELRRFFRVASLAQVGLLSAYAPAFRRAAVAEGREIAPYALAAWLHCGEILADDCPVGPFDRDALRQAVPEIRALTTEQAEGIEARIRSVLGPTGVAFVLLAHFPRTYVYGATFRPSTERAVLLMNIRGRYADMFWFGLLHEVAHILLHESRLFVEVKESRSQGTALEAEANAFARDVLVPAAPYSAFVAASDFAAAAVRGFAESIGVDPGIIVGRLQHDGHVMRDHLNGLRTRWTLAPDPANEP